MTKVDKYKGTSTAKSRLFPKQVMITDSKGSLVHIKEVSCGDDVTLAVDSVGHLYSGGNPMNGMLGISPGLYSTGN